MDGLAFSLRLPLSTDARTAAEIVLAILPLLVHDPKYRSSLTSAILPSCLYALSQLGQHGECENVLLGVFRSDRLLSSPGFRVHFSNGLFDPGYIL